MDIKQLNCAACGAPITVPDDVDHLNCSSCGSFLAVQRGEGYIALKMVEKVAQVIQDSAYVTQSELKKLQYSQEISLLEMQLNTIRGELRGLMRAAPDQKINQQIQDLHYQEYLLLERLRKLHWSRAITFIPDPNQDPDVLQSQISFIQAELAALKQAAPYNPQVRKAMSDLGQHSQNLTARLHEIKVTALKKRLKSFRPEFVSASDLEAVKVEMSVVAEDIKSLSIQPNSPETQAVLSELRKKQNTLTQQWRELENQRIASALRSGDITSRFSSDSTTERIHLALIQSDIQMLENWEVNSEVKAHLSLLQKKEKDLTRHLRKLEKAASRKQKSDEGGNTTTGIGCLSLLGLSALFASIWNTFNNRISRSSLPAKEGVSGPTEQSPAVLTPEDVTNQDENSSPSLQVSGTPISQEVIISGETAGSKPGSSFWKSCLIALIPLLGMFCLSLGVYAIIPQSEPGSTYNPGMGIFFGGIWIGYMIGAWKFFQGFRSSSGSGNLKSRALPAVLAGSATWLGIYLFFLSILGFMDSNSDAYSNVIMTGFCLGPLLGMGVFLYQLSPEAQIWKPVHKLLSKI